MSMLGNGEPSQGDMNDNTWCDELLKDYNDKRNPREEKDFYRWNKIIL